MRRVNIVLLAGSAMLLSPAIMPTATAQQSTVPGARADVAGALEEVVVTARKREERLQDVPSAVTALDEERIRALGAVDIRDVEKLTPGLFYRAFSNQVPTLWIRGIGTRAFDAGAEASVGTFIDGVYMGRFGSQLQDLADVARVEVLRGPQGPLFGRNTIGGAINIITRQPTNEFYARANVTYGHDAGVSADTFNVDALISGPISGDTLLGQLSASRSDMEGTTRLLNADGLANGTGTQTVRGRLVFKPSESLRLDLSSDWFSSLSNRYGWVWHANSVNGTRPVVYGSLGATPTISPDPYTASVSPPKSDANREGWGLNLTADFEPESMSLTSITAYRELDVDYWNDFDATELTTAINAADESSSQFSQELRLASVPDGAGTFGGRLDWLVGLYYFEESIDRLDSVPAGPDGFIAGSTSARVLVDTKSWAAFGQLNVKLTEAWRLDLGLRYSEDEKEGDFATTGFLTFGFPFETSNRDNWSATDPSVSLSYRFSDEVMAFVKYSTGFKSGAYQWFATTAALAQEVAEPEDLTSWEAGLRADVLNDRLRINVNAFEYDYKNIQVPRVELINGFPTVVLTNAATSTIRGLELEGAAHLSEHWDLEYRYAHLDATYDKYVYTPTLDFSGNDLVRAPRNTFGAALAFAHDLSLGEVRARAGVDYVSSFYFEQDNAKVDAGTKESSHTTVDASIALARGALTYKVWGSNLTDESVRATVLNVGSPYLLNEIWMPRRTYGITIGAEFR